MKIRQSSLFRFRVPFREPIQVKGRTYTHRTGCLVQLVSDDKIVGWGEISPLPGFSPETLNEAIAATFDFLAHQNRQALPGSVLDLIAWLPNELPPSTAFGLTTAVLSLMAQSRRFGYLHQVIGESETLSVPVNGLLTANDTLADIIQRLDFHGFDVLKIKVGAPDVDSDIRTIHSIRELAPNLKLRLDANRQWSLDEAVYFAKAIAGSPIEYIEEPVGDPFDLPKFYAETGCPIALDETLLMPHWEEIFPDSTELIRAFILKPTFLGHPATLLNLVNRAQNDGKLVIFTGAYECGVGTGAIAELAAVWGSKNSSMGLNTYRRLAQDVLKSRLILSGKFLELNELPWSVNMALLEQIDVP